VHERRETSELARRSGTSGLRFRAERAR